MEEEMIHHNSEGDGEKKIKKAFMKAWHVMMNMVLKDGGGMGRKF